MTLTCIRCDSVLTPVNPEDRYSLQPYDGVVCSTSGNYGSRLFDAFDGMYLAFSLCDACLYTKRSEVLLYKEGVDNYVKPASKIFPSSFEAKKCCKEEVFESIPLLTRKQAVRFLVCSLGRRSAYRYVYGRTKKLSLCSLNKLVEVFHFGTRDQFEEALKEVDRTTVRDLSRKQLNLACSLNS